MTEYVFNYPSEFKTLPTYSEHAGQRCVVVRRLRLDEYDFQGDAMFLVRFSDGFEAHAYRSELTKVKE